MKTYQEINCHFAQSHTIGSLEIVEFARAADPKSKKIWSCFHSHTSDYRHVPIQVCEPQRERKNKVEPFHATR